MTGRADIDVPRHRLARLFTGVLAPGDGWVVFGGGAAVILITGVSMAFITGVSADTWVPVVAWVGLLLVSIPICFLASGRPLDTRLRRILLLALLLKMLCTFPRYVVNENFYGGEADAGQYDNAGKFFVENVHHRKWSLEGSTIDGLSDETQIVGYATGLLYLVVGTTYMGGYIVFTWVCWVGLMCFFKAFRLAYPNAPPYLAAKLIFFLPSMLYWPSSIGKDALMVFSLGVLTLGLARLLTPDKPLIGVLWLIPSSAVMVLIRPHLLLVALVGIAASMVAKNASKARTGVAVASRFALLIALVPLLFLGLNRANSMFGAHDGSSSFDLTATLNRTSAQTTIGGSSFETAPVKSPLDLPVAVISVLYRPFPFEAHSVPAFISALEGLALLIMTLAAARWIWRIGPAMRQHPFTMYCGAYVLAFVFAFSNVGNAGILARQRVQMFPLLMLLVAAAREHHRVHVELSSGVTDPQPESLGALLPT